MTDYYKRLKDLIEDTYYLNNNRRATLVAHSMGNMVILYFLNQMDQVWKDKFVARFVALAAPWAGAAKTIRVMASGKSAKRENQRKKTNEKLDSSEFCIEKLCGAQSLISLTVDSYSYTC